jgi:4-hydroxy-4-methyl-2-oxoglutarate aldolase
MMIHAAVEVVQEGDLLIVTTTSPSTDGMFGDLLAKSLMIRGAVGLVIEAGVRDTSTLRSMGFPVWSRAIHAQGTVKATAGSVNIPIVCAGVAVEPGDVVVADDDGVVVVSRSDASATLEASNSRLEKEDETREKLESGDLSLDFYGFRGRLEDLGVSWVDRQQDS